MREMPSRPGPPWWCEGRATTRPQAPVGPGVAGLGPEDICMLPPSVAGRGQPPGSGRRWWAPDSEGGGVALRPLRTWNGEGASGEGMRQGPEGEHPHLSRPREVSAGPWRQRVTGWPGKGVWREVRQWRHERQNGWDAEVGSLPWGGVVGARAQLQGPRGQRWADHWKGRS